MTLSSIYYSEKYVVLWYSMRQKYAATKPKLLVKVSCTLLRKI